MGILLSTAEETKARENEPPCPLKDCKYLVCACDIDFKLVSGFWAPLTKGLEIHSDQGGPNMRVLAVFLLHERTGCKP